MIASETLLYAPIKNWLVNSGFKVAGEVRSCDLVATHPTEPTLLIVEMKRVFNLELIFQGIQRQKMTSTVYLAVEEPTVKARRRWRKVIRLCRLLGLGLITVRFSGRRPTSGTVIVELDPKPYKPRPDSGSRKLLLREFQERSADFNTGGTCRRPIVTAYREEALRIAFQLGQNGPSKVRQVADAANSRKAGSILLDNYYGWFERVKRGVYGLTAKGKQALTEYAHVCQQEIARGSIIH